MAIKTLLVTSNYINQNQWLFDGVDEVRSPLNGQF
jgi:hypothetical protein